jgi:hypothetical protein
VQALTLLRRRAADLSDTEFNRAVSAIVTGLRDAHTRYIGPSTLRDRVAVTFGLQARIAVELWSNAPPVMIKKVPHPSSRDATKLITEWRSAVADLRTVVTPDPEGDNSGPNYGSRFSESDYAPIPRGDLPYGVPSWLGDDSRGRQSRPKRRNTVERDPADLMHTLIWRAPTK